MEVPITRKQFHALGVLLDARGSVVTRATFFEKVWSDSIVEDANLTQVIFTLRRLLGKLPDGTPYIDTVPKRGYRMSPNAVATLLVVPAVTVRIQPTPVAAKLSLRARIFRAFRSILRSGGMFEQQGETFDIVAPKPNRNSYKNKMVA